MAVLAVSLIAYAHAGAGWLLFAILFLVPDLSMLGYAAGERAGAFSYNLFHTYTVPLVIGAAGAVADNDTVLAVALIWSAHIGFDRMLGYGLKLGPFKETHLGPIGKQS